MIKYLRSYKFGLLLCCLLFSSVTAFGQDLGSSSGLFRSTKKKSTSSKKKKTSTRKKSTSKKKKYVSNSRRRSAKRSTRRTSKSRRNKVAARKRKTSRKSNRKKSVKKSVTQTARKQPVKKDIASNKLIIYGGPDGGNPAEMLERTIENGNVARNHREYVKAEKAYNLAKQMNDKDSRPIYGLGNLYSDQQRWEEAENAYRKAIEMEPKNPSPYVALSFVLTQPVVGSSLGKRYIEAEKMARQALVLSPNNPIAFDQLGVAMELRGLISHQTRNAYRKAIELEPTFAVAYAHLGRILQRNGLATESSRAYRKAVQLADDVPTMITIADVMQSQRKFKESEQLLRNALRYDPKHPTALFLLGRALTIKKSFREAERVLIKSVEVSPNSFVSYALLGSLYSRSGQLTKAEKTLNRALKVISSNEKKRLAQEFEEVGDGFVKVRRKKDAKRVYEQALSLDPKNKLLIDKAARLSK